MHRLSDCADPPCHTDEPYEYQVTKPEFCVTVPWVAGASGTEGEAALREASAAARAQRLGASWAPQEELVARLVRYATANLYVATRCVRDLEIVYCGFATVFCVCVLARVRVVESVCVRLTSIAVSGCPSSSACSSPRAFYLRRSDPPP